MVLLNSLLEAVYAVRYGSWLQPSLPTFAFKGPFLGEISSVWFNKALSSKRAYLEFYEVSEVWIASNLLITSDPDVMIRMSLARSKYTRSPWYAGQKVDFDHNNIFSTIEEDIHNKKRSQMAIGYSGKDIDSLETMIDGHILEFMNLTRTKYLTIGSNLKPMDFACKASFFTMDVLTEIAFEKMIPTVIKATKIPWLSSLLKIPFLRKLVMPSGKAQTGPGRLIAVSREIVQSDMMGSFIRHGVSRSEVASEIQLQIDRPIISEDEARKLPYLRSVINEGVRMLPLVTGNMPKVVPPEGDTINGRFVPGGTWIGRSDWAIQRSTKIYGDDAAIFRPERWLEAKGETMENMERTVGLLRGHGKCSCLGKNITWMELNKIFFELFKNPDITIADPSHPWKSDNYGLWLQKEMFVKVTERNKSH
ncbi:cytochrome P450 [Acephala macrosclerotiorum]|nr:cytochrome P450 [Acephala macrosclerotiorum]